LFDVVTSGLRTCCGAIVLLASVLAFGAMSARAENGCDLECSLTAMLVEEGLPGAVYSIVEGDITRVGAVGVANHQRGDRLRPDAKVHIGSVTKTMIALGVLRLATLDRVDLDAPLDKLLPHVQFDNPWRSRSAVTLRHLLDHTAGLEDLRLWQMFTTRAEPTAPLVDAFNRAPEVLRIRSEPGTQFSYSNMGYTLAGMVIEAVTGERYESWLDRELLRPLGMHDSTFEFVTQTGPRADGRLAWGHYDDLTPVPALPVWLRPAAQFTTTANDMARAARFLMGDGRLDGALFVDDGLLRQMGWARTTTAAKAGLKVGYALGLAARDRHGAVGLCHLGNIVGFRAALCMYPEHGKAFFVSHNGDNEDARYGRFDALMTQTLGVATPVVPTIEQTAPPLAWQGRYILAPARFEAFRYFDLLVDSVTLDVRAEGMELHRLGGDKLPLTAVGPNLYRAADRVVASHVLLSHVDNSDAFSDGTHTLRKVSGVRYALNWISLALGIIGLLALLLTIPIYRVRRKDPVLQPASLALLLLLMPLSLFALQPFTAIGDVTPASVSVYVATLALPLLLVIHSIWLYRNRQRVRAWLLHVVGIVFVLQWCASLYAWGLLPFALWT
jgi:CubicO group peptidase (beta-lactamase class C family)